MEGLEGFITLKEAAERWGISDRRINALCLQGRIEGAIKFGNTWAIPQNAQKPADARIKSGTYVKKCENTEKRGN